MKKLLLVCACTLLGVATLFAQRTIRGTVTDNTNEPLIGASVLVKGTNSGTVTDVDGRYELSVPSDATTLVISYTGFTSQEVTLGSSDVVDVTLDQGITLEEAVVTALGISRDRKALGYSVQQVGAEQLNLARESNVVNAIAGKVAGVQIVGSPSSGFRSGNIRIRGVNGLSGNDPLYVLDGTPVDAAAINVDNVESISVLKGPSAAALYGQRAAGGVVVVTSKKGKGGTSGIEVNSATTFETVSLLPEYQNEYGGGYSQEFIKFQYNPNIHPASWAAFEGQNMLDYSADESWGPKLDGTMYRPYYSWFPGTPDFGKEVPLTANPDNVKDFFETGLTANNNVAFYTSQDNYNLRVNYNNISRTLTIPNARQIKNIVNITGSYNVLKNFTVNANINYLNTDQHGNILEGYGGGLTGSFNQWFQRQLDMSRLRQYKNPDGSFNSWNIKSPEDPNPLYWDNPYYDVYENVPQYDNNRAYGHVSLAYKFNDHFRIEGFLRSDVLEERDNNRVTEGGLNVPYFRERENTFTERNYELLASYDQSFGKVSVNANLGGNIRRDYEQRYSAETVGGLAIPGFYDIRSSVNRPNITNNKYTKEVRSVYGRASVGFNNMLYLDASLRNDWSSALPTDNNSYLYPSIGGSFVFTELPLFGSTSFLSFGKVRYSYAQVGSDIDAHQINQVYPAGAFYGTLPTQGVPNTLRNASLVPALTSSNEAGVELRFLNNRVGVDVTYYRDDNRDQILQLNVPASSGYTVAIINAGNIARKGWEVQLTGTPVSRPKFSWDITVNWASNESVVEELAEGLDNRVIGGSGFEGGPFWNGIAVNARVGEEWGTLVGRKFKRDASGNRIINEDGTFAFEANQNLGSILPDFTGGVINQFSFLGFNLGVSVDYQKGGKYYSVTKMFNAYSGLSKETVGLNDRGNPKRDPVDAGGGVRAEGVFADGRANDVYIEAKDYYESLFGLHEAWILDASFVKLREVNLGYTFDLKRFNIGFIRSLQVSAVARNLAIFGKNVKSFDPSELERYWYEGGQLPQTRSLGFNVRLGF